MKFAINYSQKADSLVRSGKIKVDLFKCPDYDFDPKLVEQAKNCSPIYIHFPLNVGQKQLLTVDWTKIEKQIEDTGTPYVNLHLVAYQKDFPQIPMSTVDAQHKATLVEQVLEEIKEMQERFGSERIIIENIVHRGPEGKILRPAVEPDVMEKILRESGCGLLLDLAHAQMTAKYLDVSVYDYLSHFPTDRLRELHITGIQKDDSGMWRDSMPMTDEDWTLAEWAMDQINSGAWPAPWVVSFEYGGEGPKFEWRTDTNVIETQTPRLYNLVKK